MGCHAPGTYTCLFMFLFMRSFFVISRKPWKKPFLTLTIASYPLSMMMLSSKVPTFSEHYQNVSSVLTPIHESGFTLKTDKCKFSHNTLPYLGHIIHHGQIRLDPSHVEAIVNLPLPKNPKTLTEFLRMAQFRDHLICTPILSHCSSLS